MAKKKITQLKKITSAEDTDLLLIQRSNEGTYSMKFEDLMVHVEEKIAESSVGGTVKLTTTTPLQSKISSDVPFVINFSYTTSVYNKKGSVKVYINNELKLEYGISEGNYDLDVTKYLVRGDNTVKLEVSNSEGVTDFLIFSVNVVSLSVTSTFTNLGVFSEDILFNYTANGNLSKDLYIKIDDEVVHTETLTSSGVFRTCTIPKPADGVHTLTCYIESELDGTVLKSNILSYTISCITETGTTPIIASDFDKKEVDQYSILTIPYTVATPGSLNSSIEFYVNGSLVGTAEVDRNVHSWTLSDYPVGEVTLKLKSGESLIEFTILVKEVTLNIEVKEDNLELFLTAANRINDSNKEVWSNNGISATFNNFNWVSNGWLLDDEGLNVLKVNGSSSVYIPLNIFGTNFKGTGKSIEFEFKISDVTDYNADIITCFNNNIGFKIGCKEAILKTNEATLSTLYKDEERLRVSFSVESTNQNRIISIYINGILSGLMQYTSTDLFQQQDPVGITIGSPSCTLDLYNIRVYNAPLSYKEALNNYIYDMNDPVKKLQLYGKNNIYNEYGDLSYNKVLDFIPCMTITGELPPVKGDKKYVSIDYTNLADSSKNFSESNVEIDIQGTSSQYYPKKNYKFTLNNEYKLRTNSIAEKVFCIKADYMESSHSHNTGMAKIVHNMYSQYVPNQTADNGVRTTIDGFPIVLFYKENEDSPRQYVGIYNFNNDKDDVNTFGYSGDCESWEVCNNTSQRTLFRLSEYERLDNNGKPEWQTDFEARYPAKYKDYTNLKRLTDWIVSTEGNLEKFKNEFNQYFNLHYTLVYAVLTELFAMVDSRAKNMFLTTWDKKIWYPVFYDMDTCFGLNNEGVLTFDYSVETNDTIGNQNVFNGKNSLLWQNFEQAFASEIKDMYNTLRDSDKLTYESVMEILEGQQIEVLCEVLYNEDANYKYLNPLLVDNIGTYLYIAQGSRLNHLKYWLYNRFNYMDSKYLGSDYKTDYATMRLYTPSSYGGVTPNADFTITPFADQYVTVNYGGYIVTNRGYSNEVTTINSPDIQFNDTETIIYGASKIASLGDLSDKYAGTVDMSKATQLTELIIGSSNSNYSNTNLHDISVGNNKLLRKIDVRNCPNLTQPLDLSKCDSIEEVYATGTGIGSINLSDKATELKTLHIPNTISTLELLNKPKLQSITSEGYNSLNTLIIENSSLNPFSIMSEANSLVYVRLINLNCATSVSNVQKLLSYKGLDEKGNETSISQAISGKITLTQCSKEIEAELKAAFPNVTFHVIEYLETYTVNFLDGDGSILYTTKVIKNGEAIYNGPTPTKDSDDQYHYTWEGEWDTPLKPILQDTTIKPVFKTELRYYTIRFINGVTEEVLASYYLAYGSTVSVPSLPSGHSSWVPVVTTVKGDMDYRSKYVPYPEDLSIFEFTDNDDGTCRCELKYLSTLPSTLIIPYKNTAEKAVSYFYAASSVSSYKSNREPVTSIYIPDTGIKIGTFALAFMKNLTGVLKLPPSVGFWDGGTIGSIFQRCEGLTGIIMPGATFIPVLNNSSNGHFGNCISLEYVVLGSAETPFTEWRSVSDANYHNFYGCNNLKTINLVTKNGLSSDVKFATTLPSSLTSKIVYSKEPMQVVTTEVATYAILDEHVEILSYT